MMAAINATNARKNLYKLIKEVGESHEPVTITGKDSSAVLVNEDDWNAIQETLHLLSSPGMADSIHKGLATPVDECDPKMNW
jgi:antitoxin YefM